MRNGKLIDGERAGNSARQGPGLRQVGIASAVAYEHRWRRLHGRPFAAIQGDQPAVGEAGEEKAAAADAAVVSIHDAQGERRCDGSVDRVAAALKDLHAGVRGQWVDAGNHAVARHTHVRTGGSSD